MREIRGSIQGEWEPIPPVEYVSEEDMRYVEDTIVLPTVTGLLKDGIDFSGIIYFGLIRTDDGVKVIEYNTRFGDPEAEVLLEAMNSDLIEAISATFEKRPFTPYLEGRDHLRGMSGFYRLSLFLSEGAPG